MSDLISRQAMIDTMRRHRALFCKNRIEFMVLPKDEKARVDEIDNCISDLVNAPPAEPERKKGEWIGDCCSCCGVSKYNYVKLVDDECGPFGTWNFCPHCGADMRGTDEITGQSHRRF